MNRAEIIAEIQSALSKKLIGTKYNNKQIIDVEVNIDGIDEGCNCCDSVFFSYEDFSIKVKITSPKGKVARWVNYYF